MVYAALESSMPYTAPHKPKWVTSGIPRQIVAAPLPMYAQKTNFGISAPKKACAIVVPIHIIRGRKPST
jgi:hypothetical protein